MRLLKLFTILGFLGISQIANAQQTQKLYLSGTAKDHTKAWEFYCTDGRNCGEWSTIEVPSQRELQGFGNYSYGLTKHRTDEKGLYKYVFTVPNSWKGKSIWMHFEGVMNDAVVRINGQSAGPTHQGGFYSFSYEVSDLLNYDVKKNLLKVIVSKQSGNESVNRSERHADYWVFGGIFRPVYLEAKLHGPSSQPNKYRGKEGSDKHSLVLFWKMI